MQNLFTGEQHARIMMERYHAEARRHDLLKLARAGHPRRTTGAAFTATARERVVSAIRRMRLTTSQPSCQPCVACQGEITQTPGMAAYRQGRTLRPAASSVA